MPDSQPGLLDVSNTELAEAEIAAGLRRILESRAFSGTPVLRRFLQFVVERTLQGHQDQLKEYALGVDVFDRGPDFDARADTIVRVEARRLRMRLAAYYDGPGSTDPIIIDVPKGSYVPSFRRRALSPGGEMTVLAADSTGRGVHQSPPVPVRASLNGPDRIRSRSSSAVCWLLYDNREVALPDGEYIVGREPEAAVRLDSRSVSRQHARILVSGPTATLEDLGSKNGSFVGGVRLSAPTPLKSGDSIRIGPLTLIFKAGKPLPSTETDEMTWPVA